MDYKYKQLDRILDDIGYEGDRDEHNYNALIIILSYLEHEYPQKHEYYIKRVINNSTMRSIAKPLNITPQAVSHHIMFYRSKLQRLNIYDAINRGYITGASYSDVLEPMIKYSRFADEFSPDMVNINDMPIDIDIEFIDAITDDIFKTMEISVMDYVVIQVLLENIKHHSYRLVSIYRRHLVHKHTIEQLSIEFDGTVDYIQQSIDIVRVKLKNLYLKHWKDMYVLPGSKVFNIYVKNMFKAAGYPIVFEDKDNKEDRDSLSVFCLNLDVSTRNALGRAGYETIGVLRALINSDELWYEKVRCIGKKRAYEIVNAIGEFDRTNSEEEELNAD